MARTTSKKSEPAAAEAAPARDLHAELLVGLAEAGIKPKVKWAPSKNYASLYVGKDNIGYAFRQTRVGVRLEPAASTGDLKTAKQKAMFAKGSRSERFALVGLVDLRSPTLTADVKTAVEVLVLAARKAMDTAPSAEEKAKAKRVAAKVKKNGKAKADADAIAAEMAAEARSPIEGAVVVREGEAPEAEAPEAA